jgi:hypothetical protein
MRLEIEQKLFSLLHKAKRGSMGVFFYFPFVVWSVSFWPKTEFNSSPSFPPKKRFQG